MPDESARRARVSPNRSCSSAVVLRLWAAAAADRLAFELARSWGVRSD